MLHYREWPPPAALAGVVEAIWSLQSAATAPSASGLERILPDGCSELILNFGDPVEQLSDGVATRQPRLLFVGQLPGPLLIRPTGPVDLMGVRFRPAGAAGFIREPQSRLTGIGTPLVELAPRLSAALAREPLDAPDPAVRVRAIGRALAAQGVPAPSPVSEAANRLVRSWGTESLDWLARQTGLGSRQLSRRFLTEVGLRPKLLARICRFQQVFRALEYRPAHWTRVAVECGYYDSSHLIRDFRELAGETPVRLIEQSQRLTRVFTRAGRRPDLSD